MTVSHQHSGTQGHGRDAKQNITEWSEYICGCCFFFQTDAYSITASQHQLNQSWIKTRTEIQAKADNWSEWTQIAVLKSESNIHKNRQFIMHHMSIKLNERDEASSNNLTQNKNWIIYEGIQDCTKQGTENAYAITDQACVSTQIQIWIRLHCDGRRSKILWSQQSLAKKCIAETTQKKTTSMNYETWTTLESNKKASAARINRNQCKCALQTFANDLLANSEL